MCHVERCGNLLGVKVRVRVRVTVVWHCSREPHGQLLQGIKCHVGHVERCGNILVDILVHVVLYTIQALRGFIFTYLLHFIMQLALFPVGSEAPPIPGIQCIA